MSTLDVASLVSELVAHDGATLAQAAAAVREANKVADACGLREGPERGEVVTRWSRRLATERKACPKCGEHRPLVEFYGLSAGAVFPRQSKCKPCDNADRAQRTAEELGEGRRSA